MEFALIRLCPWHPCDDAQSFDYESSITNWPQRRIFGNTWISVCPWRIFFLPDSSSGKRLIRNDRVKWGDYSVRFDDPSHAQQIGVVQKVKKNVISKRSEKSEPEIDRCISNCFYNILRQFYYQIPLRQLPDRNDKPELFSCSKISILEHTCGEASTSN